MQLPGQLKDTTLGDLLGALYREKADGTLELLDSGGGRHRIVLREGQIEGVETEAKGPRLGDLLQLSRLPEVREGERLGQALLDEGFVNHAQLSKALKRQTLARLELVFQISDAQIRFHAPRPRSPDPTLHPALSKRDFLDGRPRSRGDESSRKFPASRRFSGALQVLELAPNATSTEIRQAFRRLAAHHHPDRHPDADTLERALLMRKFAEISRAYHTLTG